MFRDILVGYDGSTEAEAALDVAAALAADLRAKLTVAAVSDASGEHDPERANQLKQALQRVPGEVPACEHAIYHGSPGPALVQGAREQEADLIVVGSRDSEEELPVAFSAARFVLDRAHCPVLVVRHGVRVVKEPSLTPRSGEEAPPSSEGPPE